MTTDIALKIGSNASDGELSNEGTQADNLFPLLTFGCWVARNVDFLAKGSGLGADLLRPRTVKKARQTFLHELKNTEQLLRQAKVRQERKQESIILNNHS